MRERVDMWWILGSVVRGEGREIIIIADGILSACDPRVTYLTCPHGTRGIKMQPRLRLGYCRDLDDQSILPFTRYRKEVRYVGY